MKDELKVYTQPAFLICAAILAVAGSGMSIAIKSFGVYLHKEPLPLKKSLELLDESDLTPYKVISKEKIESEDVIKSLGTKDYIQWVLEDSQAEADSPVRLCSLFITYYDRPDVVPHVPEECYMGGGYQRLSSDSVILETDKGLGSAGKIPARCLLFSARESDNWTSGVKFPVLYLFNVNGTYGNSRENVRLALNKNIRGKYSYFCKVEWSFFNLRFGTRVYPGREETIEASQRLLGIILPVLETEHWPVWEK